MIFGMTSRFNEPGYQGVIWRLWDEFNIRNSTMIGPFDAHPAVTVHHHAPRAKPTAGPSGATAAPPTNWSGPYSGYIAGCAGPGPGSPPPPCLTDLTTGIADWKLLDDGSSAPTTTPPAAWYEPTGQGKWLGYGDTGEVNKSYGYTLSFEVNPPALPFPLLTSNL